jgi:hypothetical protein
MIVAAEDQPVKFVVTFQNGAGRIVSCALCARENREVTWVIPGKLIASEMYFALLDHARHFHEGTSVQVS